MRPLPLAAALALAAAAPAAGAPHATSAPVLIVADVGESAQRGLPAALWRKLATEYVNARTVAAEQGTALPDDARCRSAHAIYAVLATFDRATRLPGLAQDTDRAYGIARFTVRNCLTGTVAPTKTIRVESEPLSVAARGDEGATAEQTWERAIRTTLARDPLVLAVVARIARVENGVAYLESASGFYANQVLRAFADANEKPYTAPVELVVVDTMGKYVIASVSGKVMPHVGDYVEARK